MKRNARIGALLVADDPEKARGYELKLDIDGYLVTTVYSMEAARKELAGSKPQVVFVMQPLLAQELVRLAHGRPELAQLTVIGLTQGTGRAILLKPPLMLEAS